MLSSSLNRQTIIHKQNTNVADGGRLGNWSNHNNLALHGPIMIKFGAQMHREIPEAVVSSKVKPEVEINHQW